MLKILNPLGISFLVFESDGDRTLPLAGESKRKVEEIVVHEPALLLYLLHTFNQSQIYFVLHLFLDSLYDQLLFKRIQSHQPGFQSFGKGRYFKDITLSYWGDQYLGHI
jgi:hypothetical protein